VRVGPSGATTRLAASTARSTQPRKKFAAPRKSATKRDTALIDLGRGADLLDPAIAHDDDPVGHCHRLVLVVGDEHGRDPEALLQPAQFRLHALAQALVERSERFIEQQQHRFDDQCPGQPDPLLLAPGQLRRQPVAVTGQLHQRRLRAGNTHRGS
jgi:hypothetical protein